jgi:hypothetical protein
MSIKPEQRTLIGADRTRAGAVVEAPSGRRGAARAERAAGLDIGQIERAYDRLVAWTEGGLAVLVSQTPRPPMVTLALPDERVPAALLVWPDRSAAGGPGLLPAPLLVP